MSKQIDTPYRKTKVSVRRLVAIGALSGALIFGGVAIASASTAHLLQPKVHPLHGFGGPYGARPVVDGKVTAVGTGSFTVLDRSLVSYTVTVTGTTMYKEHNVSSVGIGDVKVGTFVDVAGSVSGTTVTATEVRIETHESTVPPLRPLRARPDAVGRVIALGMSSFTIKDRAEGSLTVDTNNATTYEEPGVTSPSFRDIKVGDVVAVWGTTTGSSVDATDVHIGDRHPLGTPMGSPDFDRMPRLQGSFWGRT